MHGPSAIGGLLWLGALRAAEELARRDGDATAADSWSAAYRRVREAFEHKLWREGTDGYYAYDGGGAVELRQRHGRPRSPASGTRTCRGWATWLTRPASGGPLRTIHARNVVDFGGRAAGCRERHAPRRHGRRLERAEPGGLDRDEATGSRPSCSGVGSPTRRWETAGGIVDTVWQDRGLWFRTPEAYDRAGNYRASLYLRPLAIWAIEEARRRASRATG